VKRTEPPTPEEFNRLLEWLDPNRERAGVKFEEIRGKVTKTLVRRQCYAGEELWDETYCRVSHRVQDVAPTYVGDPALYFYGVAKRVFLEWVKRPPVPNPPPLPDGDEDEDVERIHACLHDCLNKLDANSRTVILKYFQHEKRAKIDSRKQLASSEGVTLNTLRMQVHRNIAKLRECIAHCLKNTDATEAGHVLAG
jgi:RNA polymerase sigma factor (sigma-70 family)